jgi:hypothetical protein
MVARPAIKKMRPHQNADALKILQPSRYVDCVAFFKGHIGFFHITAFAEHAAKAL